MAQRTSRVRHGHRRARKQHGQGQQTQSLTEFFERCYEPAYLDGRGYALKQHFRSNVRYLSDLIGRTAVVDDLTSDNLNQLIEGLFDAGLAYETVVTYRKVMMSLARSAHAAGALDRLPQPRPVSRTPGEPATPLDAEQLGRLLKAARSIPEPADESDHPRTKSAACRRLHVGCDGIPGRLWWLAFVLVLIDTRAPLCDVLSAPPSAWRAPDHLALGPFVYALHPVTSEAVALLAGSGGKRQRLFPWTLDNERPPFYMLYRAYRTLLYRAALPYRRSNLVNVLQATGAADTGILDRCGVPIDFTPVPGEPVLPRAVRPSRAKPPSTNAQRPVPDVGERLLRRFFQDVYAKKRLVGSPPSTIKGYTRSIKRFAEFLGRESTVDDFSDDVMNEFIVWGVAGGRVKNITANGWAVELLALWRYAYRKRLIDDLPRDIDFLKVNKTEPEAWSQQQLARLLRSCAAEPGRIAEIRAGLFWSALVLVIYDTGVRIGAVLALRVEDIDLESGWLRVPADVQKQKADQVFRLHAETLRLLVETRPAERDELFPWPWHNLSKTFYPRFNAILRRAGLPHGKRDKFHKIRRTHATYYADVAGEEAAQRQLGHSSIQTTRRYIDRSKLTRRDQPADVIPRPDWRDAG